MPVLLRVERSPLDEWKVEMVVWKEPESFGLSKLKEPFLKEFLIALPV